MLLLQRLALRIEQARVLHGDHGLVGKGGNQLDLPLAERLHPETNQHDDADELAFTYQRHPKLGVSTPANRFEITVFRVGSSIFDVDRLPVQQYAPDGRVAARRERKPAHECVEVGFVTKGRRRPVCLVIADDDMGRVRRTQPRGGFDQRVQNRLEVERRPADHLQHVARGGLILERLCQIVGASADLVQQAGVLDGDHGLRCKAPEKRDLLFRERAHLLAGRNDLAQQPAVLAQGHPQQGPDPALCRHPGHRVVERGDVERVVEVCAVDQAPQAGAGDVTFEKPFRQRFRYVVQRNGTKLLAVVELQAAMSHPAKRVRFGQNSLEHRRKVARRRVDDLQHLGRRGLLFQRLALLGVQTRVLGTQLVDAPLKVGYAR